MMRTAVLHVVLPLMLLSILQAGLPMPSMQHVRTPLPLVQMSMRF